MQLESVLAAVEKGASVVTANNRLARHVKSLFDQYQQNQGRLVWPSADVLPVQTWLNRLYSDCQALDAGLPFLLSPRQEQKLWESLIEEDKAQGFVLLNVPATAREVAAAWRIAHAYEFDFNNTSMLSLDQEQFLHWAGAFLKRCDALGYTDSARLATLVRRIDLPCYVQLPKQILLAGFYELSPQEQRLFNALQDFGCTVERIDTFAPPAAHMARVSPADDATELDMAAAWARQALEADDAKRVAIVVPDLQDRKPAVEHALRTCFFPGLNPQQIDEHGSVWNISLGEPLALSASVETALLILKLTHSSLSSQELTQLLLSVYLTKGETEKNQRAHVDANPATRRFERISLTQLIAMSRDKAKTFAKALRELEPLETDGQRQASAWLPLVHQALRLMGWPGERTLSSAEYQQVEQFRDELAKIASLDELHDSLSWYEVLTEIQAVVHGSVFQVQTAEAPLQVLGLLEAGGLFFDAVWVCSMDNDKWPPKGSATPYLPLDWQRKAKTPHASAEREFDFANYLLRQLQAAAPDVIFSHVLSRDENALDAAQMIADLPVLTLEIPVQERLQTESVALQKVQDDVGLAVSEEEKVRGGSGFFSDQAACPFRAYVKHRLLGRPLERSDLQVDPRDRGNLLHKTLENFWLETKDQASLLAMDEAQLGAKIFQLANACQRDISQHSVWSRLDDMEVERAVQIILDWLQLEKTRRPFRVKELEQNRLCEFEGLALKLQVDRIDTVESGQGEATVILDYKTGSAVNEKSWMQDRPGEPQLPIYALTCDEVPAAICYVHLHAKEQGFKGYAHVEDLLPGIDLPKDPDNPKEFLTWDSALLRWREQLHELADEIKTGVASVTPEKYACSFCELQALCRVEDTQEESA